jgi:hypothetical protein
MSQTETTDSIGHLDVSRSPKENLLKLAEQARQAYEQKRTKECLDLTRAILLVDPDNAAANCMRSSIQSEMHRDLEKARVVLREAQSKEGAENRSTQNQTTSSEASPLDTLGSGCEAPLPENVPPPDICSYSLLTFRTQCMSAVVLVAVGLVIACVVRLGTRSNSVNGSPRARSVSNIVEPIENLNLANPGKLLLTASEKLMQASVPAPAPTAMQVPSNVAPSPAQAPTPMLVAGSAAVRPLIPDPPLGVPSGRDAGVKSPDPAVASQENGTLAVSSPTSVDIYKDDTYIGSAPVSLQLPPGMQTLEYRHGSLSKKLTHVINSNETTRAMITFELDVRINSKPWAEVFLDGVERKPLGQTPLSGVRVPIGSVLVFENPGFPAKKYRVTGNETGIQIVFP